jgi:hypothetical protein
VRFEIGVAAMVAVSIAAIPAKLALADEGGVSFWLPGSYGSLSAVPSQPGWSIAAINYYTSVSAGKSFDFARGGGVQAGVASRVDFLYLLPSYVFETPVLGGQAAISLGGLLGPNTTSVSATLTGPGARSISGGRSDSIFGIGDLYPTASLRWNAGVSNFMTYVTGDIPVGSYNANRLANLGIGHGAIDAGGGYTYFDPVKGHEFSFVVGATYNLMNPSTRRASGLGRVAISE